MRNTWLIVAVLLAANGSVCRADDIPVAFKTAVTEWRVGTDERKDAGKDYVEAIGAKDAAACTPAAPKKSGIICAAPARCRCGRGAECFQRLWAWMTYCPLKKSGMCDCCHKCSDCLNPPLYTYFLDPYHACASGNGCATTEPAGCGAWAHR